MNNVGYFIDIDVKKILKRGQEPLIIEKWNMRYYLRRMSKGKKEAGSPIPQAKLMRVLEFIAIINGTPKSVEELSEKFKMSTRSVYRYLKLLEAVGFVIEKDFEKKHFIFTAEHIVGSTNFSIEESKLLKGFVTKISRRNPLYDSISKKLTLNSDLVEIPKVATNLKINQFISKLSKSIRSKKQITLRSYHSANSNEIKDRLVEPINFSHDFQSIIALDTNDKKCKQFKLDRIGDVVEKKLKFRFEKLHEKKITDIFGFSGDANTWIKMNLSLRAFLLLREEYPLSIPYLEKTQGTKSVSYEFHGPVSSFEGIGRFVMGLIEQIEIKSPKAFHNFMLNKITNAQQRYSE